MHDILELGGAVRAARTRAGMTQSALAAACGLSRQTVAQLEAGSFSDLGIRKIERVLAQLGLRLRVETDAAAVSPASGRSASPSSPSVTRTRSKDGWELCTRITGTFGRRFANSFRS